MIVEEENKDNNGEVTGFLWTSTCNNGGKTSDWDWENVGLVYNFNKQKVVYNYLGWVHIWLWKLYQKTKDDGR